MPVYIPCLNVDRADDGGGFQIGISAASSPIGGDSAGGGLAPGISITHSDSPITLTITPLPPFIFLGPNIQFWSNLFGLGQTQIERQKIEIQALYTPILQYLHRAYGVPVRDDHALQFDSDAVGHLLRDNPALAALEPVFLQSAGLVSSGALGKDPKISGFEKRLVNQFLANAAYNGWPAHAAQQIWEGIVESSQEACWQDTLRWQRDPLFLVTTARLAVLLQYIPYEQLLAAALNGGITDPLANQIVRYWDSHEELIESIPKIANTFEWAQPFLPQRPFPQPPILDLAHTPYDERPQVMEIFRGVSVPTPRYPDFLVSPQAPTPLPAPQAPSPPPVDQAPSPVPPQVLEIPPIGSAQGRALTPGQVLELPVFKVGDQYFRVPPPDWQVLEIPPVHPQEPLPPPPPDCPPFPQEPYCPPPPRRQEPTPLPPLPGDPDWPEPQQPTPCPPECLAEIEMLRSQQEDCCDRVTYQVIPRLDQLWDWVVDLENRVPGSPPAPVSPLPPFRPAPGPVPPPEEPPDVLEIPPIPTLPPDLEDRLRKVEDCCDPAAEAERHKQLERQLECYKLDICNLGIQIWGKLAECWLKANTPRPAELEGVHAGAEYPRDLLPSFASTLNAIFASYSSGQGAGQQPTDWPQAQESPTSITASILFVAQQFAASLGSDVYSPPAPPPVTLSDGLGVFDRPENNHLSLLQWRQPALRAGESDPCSLTEIPA